MLEMWKNGKTSLENIVEKMCHNPAILFNIRKRGFIREGMYADLVLVNTNESTTVKTDNILYKCGWSPVEGYTFGSKVEKTFVNGVLKYDNDSIINKTKGLPLEYGN
jgi:dihydroorotase